MTNSNYFVHNTAIVSENSDIGEGTNIWHFSHIRENVRIGNNVNIGQNVYIDEGVTIGDNCKIQNNVSVWKGVHIGKYVYIGPSVVFTNDMYPNTREWNEDMILNTYIEDEASLGANSTIIAGITIGKFSLVGAGSVVTKNIPSNCLAYGNPAKIKSDNFRKD
tara:strand:+ start:161 stop:649 length:489 start_codon:yes stop_codon:yes gene_type:complete